MPQGYPMQGSIGAGAFLLIKLTVPGLVHTNQGINLPSAEWLEVGQMCQVPSIHEHTSMVDVTPAYAVWKELAPGQQSVPLVSIPIYLNPDLAAQSMDDRPTSISTKGSIVLAKRRRQKREWRFYMKPPGYRHAASIDFAAYVSDIMYTFPVSDLNFMTFKLAVTGPLTNSYKSTQDLVQGARDRDFTSGR